MQSYNMKTTSLCRLLVVPHSALKEICQNFMADYRVLCQNLIRKLERINAIDDNDLEYQQRSVMEVSQASSPPPPPPPRVEAPLRSSSSTLIWSIALPIVCSRTV